MKYILPLIFLGIVLYFFPEFDLAISRFFFDETNKFYFSNEPILKIIYKSVNLLVITMGIGIIGTYFYQLYTKKSMKYFDKKALVYLFMVFAFGSGVIVNLGLKQNFGRARPTQIVQFGGEKKFTPATVVNSAYIKDCHSFSCGHCSFALGFIAFFFLFRKRWILITAIGYGLIVSLGRIMQGGHFFSDFIFSWIVMLLTAKLLYDYMYKKKLYAYNATERNFKTQES